MIGYRRMQSADGTKHGLKKSLGLSDLVSLQVLLIVWLGWTGFAAKQGSTQIVLWLVAVALFYLPLAAAVISLSRAIPLEGGVYQWVKEGVSPFAGYMAGWNVTLYAITAFSVTGTLIANGFAQAIGPSGAWLAATRTPGLVITTIACLIAYLFNVRGLQLAKWLGNVSSYMIVATFAAMLYLLIRAFVVRAPLSHTALSLALPALSVGTLAVFSKMVLGALTGFDFSGVFGEECRKPGNDVARSVLIAAPLIALMYILGTSSVLAYVRPADVDVSASVPQLMAIGFGSSMIARSLIVGVDAGVNFAFFTSMVIMTGAVARLPMVAGWDGLLPAWWSELHPKFRTPSKAIAVAASSMLFFGLLNSIGAKSQEAVEVGLTMGAASLAIMYIVLFGAVAFGFRTTSWRPKAALRFAAIAAFLVSAVALVFQVIPLGEVTSRGLYALRIIAALCAINGLGAFLYWRGARRAQTIATNFAADAAE
jgi:glutamate:GABA antiporter